MLEDEYQQPAEDEEEKLDNDLESTAGQRQSKPHHLEKSQKVAAAVLAFFAFLIIIIWAVQFKKNITQPFAYQPHQQTTANEQLNNICPNGQCSQSEEELKNKDTDGDGLSDWDELNIYNTSPYLEDSDSDGFPDKQEIDNNKDPNCPAGRDCYGQNFSSPQPSAKNQTSDTENNFLEELNKTANGQTNGGEMSFNQMGKLDAATLRQMLKEAGMSEELLNQISDEELLKTWQEIISGQGE
jgi:hypothetical protein